MIDPTLEQRKIDFADQKFCGPLITLSDLTPQQMAVINGIFFTKIRGHGNDWENLEQVYSIYVSVLHEYGIMCPHPDHWSERRYVATGVRTFTCVLCKSAVLERMP